MTNFAVRVGHKILSIPICYDLFQTSVGSVKFRKKYVYDNVSKMNFDSVIDLGCGTASTIDLIPKNVSYLGVDVSEKYLEKARTKTKDRRAILVNADIANPEWTKTDLNMKKTLGLALGIYHHVNDDQLNRTIGNLSATLEPGSTVISLDPVIDQKTTKMARWFAKNDRGRYLRDPDQYAQLFSEHGFSIKITITRNDFRIPYDLLLLSATKKG